MTTLDCVLDALEERQQCEWGPLLDAYDRIADVADDLAKTYGDELQ